MELINALLAYFVIPFIMALLAYVLLHFQLLLLGRLMDFHIHRGTRLKISVAAFLGTFIGVLCLSILRGVYYG
jgi:hypothetical protein